jgi:DNA-binding PadR family transcriptional regulator
MFHMHRPGFGPGRERPFQKGDLKYLILSQLKDQPHYGYEIIRELEKRFHGFYSPSPGIVYPTLQMLEEMGYVISTQMENKKVYTVTPEGRHFLDSCAPLEEKIKQRMSEWEHPDNLDDIHRTMREYGRLGEMLNLDIRKFDQDKLKRIREVLMRTYTDVEDILHG